MLKGGYNFVAINSLFVDHSSLNLAVLYNICRSLQQTSIHNIAYVGQKCVQLNKVAQSIIMHSVKYCVCVFQHFGYEEGLQIGVFNSSGRARS